MTMSDGVSRLLPSPTRHRPRPRRSPHHPPHPLPAPPALPPSSRPASRPALKVGFDWQTLSRTGSVNLQTGDVTYAISLEALLTFPPDTHALAVHPVLIFTRGAGRRGAATPAATR